MATDSVDQLRLDVPLGLKDSASHHADDIIAFFEEKHYYTVNGERMTRSTTGLVHEFFHPFNSTAIATRMLSNQAFFELEKYREYWTPLKAVPKVDRVKTLIKLWKDNGNDAAAKGTLVHKSIEQYYNTGETVETKEFTMFMAFHNYVLSKGYLPFRSEQIVWSPKYSLAGSVDMLYVHKDDLDKEVKRLWLVDWKRSKEIRFEGYGKGQDAMGFGPMSDKQDCNFEQYSLQLNIYKYLLERVYKIEIVRMTLVILHPMQAGYEKHEVKCNKAAVREILKSIK
jgi:ATP-dependent exoDNAse (exonuclease V) beta subunit